jgi:glycosyltransferase involved in cell wall biosynthesis
MVLSVIIPDYKDPLLQKTVDSLLANSTKGDLEIIVVMDGGWTPLEDNKRVKVVHLGRNRGMRDAINAGVAIARGDFIMRTDEHCMFGEGYDQIMCESCQPNWIMTAKRYYLDPVKWEVMPDEPVECEKLVIQEDKKFSGRRWNERAKEITDPIIESMAMQGSMWLMPHKWWDDVIGELQTEGYGSHYQDSHEMVFKTWKAGGKLMFNRNTWYAHKHRIFPRTHNEGTKENPANREASWKYSLDTWGDYYKEIKEKWSI